MGGFAMKPLFFDYMVSGRNEKKVPYWYDNNQDMNLIKQGQNVIPVCHASSAILEMQTKTEADRETDDDSYHYELELLTKTMSWTEADDDIIR